MLPGIHQPELKNYTLKRSLNKYLSTLSRKDLEQEVKKLYDIFKPVREYYQLELDESTAEILQQYKDKIKAEYFPKRGFGRAGNGASRKVITEFKKISTHPKDVVELWLYRTEVMIDFTLEFGDIDEPFYNSLASGFEQACKIMQKEQLSTEFRSYAQLMLSKTFGLGWGIHDELKYIYDKYVEL